MQCLKDTGLVVPGEIEIHAVLVESATLGENSKLVSDDRVNGYKISQIMNAYKVSIYLGKKLFMNFLNLNFLHRI